MDACAVVAIAMALNLMGNEISVDQLETFIEQSSLKISGLGLPPKIQEISINVLDNSSTKQNIELGISLSSSFTAEYTSGGTRQVFINNIKTGKITIISVSWNGTVNAIKTKLVGHALVLVAYDPYYDELYFLDPATGDVISETRFNEIYPATFDEAWIEQPNIFIPAGSIVTIS